MVHVMGGGHGQDAAVVRQPVDRTHSCMAEVLHLAKLPQMEEQGELPGHGLERQKGGQNLGKQEEEVEGVDGFL